MVQAVLGATSCLLVHGIARALFADRRVALLASLVCAAYGTLICSDALLLSRSPDVFLQLRVLRLLLWNRLIAFPSGLVIPFGLVGLWLVRRSWREHFLVWSSLAVQAVFILAFFVTARYRLPMLPLLGIYAAHAGLHLLDRLRTGERAAAARLGGALAALLVVSNLGIVPVSESHHAIDHFNRGLAYEQQGEHAKAEVQMRRAVELSPHDAEALLHLCALLRNREQAEEALPFCSRAVQANPISAPAHYRLGLALERLGRGAESLKHYEQATRLAPDPSTARRALDRVRNTSPGPRDLEDLTPTAP